MAKHLKYLYIHKNKPNKIIDDFTLDLDKTILTLNPIKNRIAIKNKGHLDEYKDIYYEKVLPNLSLTKTYPDFLLRIKKQWKNRTILSLKLKVKKMIMMMITINLNRRIKSSISKIFSKTRKFCFPIVEVTNSNNYVISAWFKPPHQDIKS